MTRNLVCESASKTLQRRASLTGECLSTKKYLSLQKSYSWSSVRQNGRLEKAQAQRTKGSIPRFSRDVEKARLLRC